jgi:hypothetical protein
MSKKIGIVTFHNVYNYGGILQAFALFKVLENQNAECIDYIQPTLNLKYSHKLYNFNKSLSQNIKHFIKYYILRISAIKEKKMKNFIEKNISLSNFTYTNIEDLKNNGNNYDILISGSDQIWNPSLTGGKLDPVYLLKFGNDGVKKIAYGSSAGSHIFNEDEMIILKETLSSFDKISVREDFLKEQLTPILNEKIQVVSDPTILLTKNDWRKIEVPVNKVPDNYILLYSFDDDPNCIETAKLIAKILSCKIVSIAGNKKKQNGVDLFLNDAGPNEFLWLIDNAKFVVTNSFHGTIFSIIFEKDFYSVKKNSNPHRVFNLLNKLNLTDRIFSKNDKVVLANLKIDYSNITSKVDNLRISSMDYLIDAIQN